MITIIVCIYLTCCCIYIFYTIIGTVSAKSAPRLKCYKNASRLNRYNDEMYEVLKIGSR